MSESSDCEWCDGTGEVAKATGVFDCPYCDGTGVTAGSA